MTLNPNPLDLLQREVLDPKCFDPCSAASLVINTVI
jgi:hypothetical protein